MLGVKFKYSPSSSSSNIKSSFVSHMPSSWSSAAFLAAISRCNSVLFDLLDLFVRACRAGGTSASRLPFCRYRSLRRPKKLSVIVCVNFRKAFAACRQTDKYTSTCPHGINAENENSHKLCLCSMNCPEYCTNGVSNSLRIAGHLIRAGCGTRVLSIELWCLARHLTDQCTTNILHLSRRKTVMITKDRQK